MNKIAYLRCSTVNEDIRLKKYLSACENEKVPYTAFTWDRLNKNDFVANEVPFKHYSPYGRRWKNLGNKILWQLFLMVKLLKGNREFGVIHACDFDTMIPALLHKLLFKSFVVYDIYDCFSSSCKKLSPLQWGIRKIDLMMLKFADIIIIADEKRSEQMALPESYLNKVMVIENVPQTIFTEYVHTELDFSKILLSYVGVFDRNRGIENALELVKKNPQLVLNIAGEGALKEEVVEASKQCGRIIYHGFVNYAEGLKIMHNSNFILGMYYKTNPEHYFAAPNKYFESLLLRVPLITTRDILLGNKVTTFNTGYPLGETFEEQNAFFEEISADKENFCKNYNTIKINCQQLWQNKYANYHFEKIQQEYLSKLPLREG